MRVMHWNGNLIGEVCAEPLNGTDRCSIVGVARNRDGPGKWSDEWRNGPTSLKRVAMPTKLLSNLETNVSSTNANMLGITDPKIDVPDIQTIRN
jgi:hypothetical protein